MGNKNFIVYSVVLVLITITACSVYYKGTPFIDSDFFYFKNYDISAISYASHKVKNSQTPRKWRYRNRAISISSKMNKFPECNVFIDDNDQMCGFLGGGRFKDPRCSMEFNKGRISLIYFRDTLGSVAGPVFKFDKNGKLDHLLFYDKGKIIDTVYTSSLSKLRKDSPLVHNRDYAHEDTTFYKAPYTPQLRNEK
jgi:hypothetical protein